MNDSRSLIRNSALSSLRPFCAWITRIFEHQDRVVRRPSALRAVRIAKRRLQIGAEVLKVHHGRVGFQLVTDIAPPLQPLLNVKKTGLRCHNRLQHACKRIESQAP